LAKPWRVLVNGTVPLEWLGGLVGSDVELVMGPPVMDTEWLASRAGEFDGIVCILADRLDRQVLEEGARGRLRVVATVSAGTDHIDLEAARQLGVVVCNTPGVLADATADVAMFLVIAVWRRLGEAERLLRSGRWGGWSLTGQLGRDLAGARLGLVGYGGVARALERRALAFGMAISHWSRHPTGLPGYEEDLDRLVSSTDILSLHVPLTPETRGIIDRRRILAMRRGSVIINTARGEVLDEDALVDALNSGHLGGAGLDVYVGEPKVSERLLSAPNVVALPHVGSATIETRRRMAEVAAEGLLAVLEGRNPPNAVRAPEAQEEA